MKKFKIILPLFLMIFCISLLFTLNVSAQTLSGEGAQALLEQDQEFIEQTGLGTGVGTRTGLASMVSDIIKIFLSFLGVIFIVLIIYAGFLWMTSAGNEEKITQAKKTMTSAVIGLAIILLAYAFTYFVIDKLLEATRQGRGLPS